MERRSVRSRLKGLLVSAIGLSGQVLLHADAGVPDQLQSAAEQVRTVIQGPFVTIIVTIILAACGIAYAYNKDNEKVKAKIIAIVIGAIIVAAAKEVAEMFLPQS